MFEVTLYFGLLQNHRQAYNAYIVQRNQSEIVDPIWSILSVLSLKVEESWLV